MKKATSTLIAAVAALAMSGGVYAQSAGGSGAHGSTANSATQQLNDTNSGYGTPGSANSESGMMNKAPNSGLPNGTNNSTAGTIAPKTNNTLATPSTASPAAGQ